MTQAASTTRRADEHRRGRRRGAAAGGAGRTASRAPSRPPATPPAIAMSVPSTRMSLSQDSVWVRCVQPHSVACPTVPIATPATAPNTQRTAEQRHGRARAARRRSPSPGRAGRSAAISPKTGPTISAMPPRMTRKKPAAASAPPRPMNSRAATRARPRGAGDHERLEDQPELRDVEVVLALEDRQPEQQAAHRRGLPDEAGDAADLAVAVVGGQPAVALLLEDQQADDRQPGAGDQHQVGGAPERHVLAEEPVPDVVEREAEQRVEAGAGEQEAADRARPSRG